ncbi:MAG: hypothetical protein IPK78_16515 [Rhodospirillales bacterium]|nr:hypothetical protein [Rhodospirillales bacterium]
MFEDLALADCGNRIPNITAEITYKRTDEKPYQGLDFLATGEGGPSPSTGSVATATFCRPRPIRSMPASTASISTMREDRQARMSDVCTTTPDYFPDTPLCGEDGYLYLNVGSVTCSRRLGKLNQTLIRTARISV